MIALLRATPADADALKDLAVAAKAYWGYPAEWMAKWTNWINASPAFVETTEVYKALEAEQLLGWCALLIDWNHAHLEDLWVRPDRIGTGVGRILFEFALARAREKGASHLDLDADPNAVGFYEHMRMAVVGERKAEMDRTIPTMLLDL